MSSQEIQEFIDLYVMSIEDDIERSVFYMHVVNGESVEEISVRYELTEDKVLDILSDCQQRARQITKALLEGEDDDG